MKRNGFTLIELLVMLTVLGIIMLVAIPNISGMLGNQRLNMFKSDATSMIETAKVASRKERLLVKPKNGECIVFALNYLNDNDNIENGPNGGKYDQFDSLVVYTRSGNRYKYYVRLVEQYKGKRIGISLVDGDNVKALKAADVKELASSDKIGLEKEMNRAQGIAKLSAFSTISSKCTSGIKGYYSGGLYCTIFNNKYYDDNGNQVTPEQYAAACTH